MSSRTEAWRCDVEVALEALAVAPVNERLPVNTAAPSQEQPAQEDKRPAQTWLQRNGGRIFTVASRTAAISSLVLTGVLAWPAMTSAGDARMATLLAEWTSQKEYIEFCEAHDWQPEGCAAVRNAPLPPPPARGTLFRRCLDARLRLMRYRGEPRKVIIGGFDRANCVSSEHPLMSIRTDTGGNMLFSLLVIVLLAALCCMSLLCLLEGLRLATKAIRNFTRKSEVAKEGIIVPYEGAMVPQVWANRRSWTLQSLNIEARQSLRGPRMKVLTPDGHELEYPRFVCSSNFKRPGNNASDYEEELRALQPEFLSRIVPARPVIFAFKTRARKHAAGGVTRRTQYGFDNK